MVMDVCAKKSQYEMREYQKVKSKYAKDKKSKQMVKNNQGSYCANQKEIGSMLTCIRRGINGHF